MRVLIYNAAALLTSRIKKGATKPVPEKGKKAPAAKKPAPKPKAKPAPAPVAAKPKRLVRVQVSGQIKSPQPVLPAACNSEAVSRIEALHKDAVNAGVAAVKSSIEAGKMLAEANHAYPRGFSKWVEDNLTFSRQTAYKYIAVAEAADKGLIQPENCTSISDAYRQAKGHQAKSGSKGGAPSKTDKTNTEKVKVIGGSLASVLQKIDPTKLTAEEIADLQSALLPAVTFYRRIQQNPGGVQKLSAA
jgi:hypothetical protein